MEEKLLKWCNENFNFETQKWEYEYIPDEVLDLVLEILKKGWPSYENESECDFVNDFICSEIVWGKIWKITKIWLKYYFEDNIKHLFD